MPTDKGSKREQEFAEFAHARATQLYRSAWLLCGAHHEAEDLVQETLAKVYAKWRHPLSRIDNPAAYAQTTLTRTFLSGRRRRSNDERSYADVPELPIADPTDRAASRLAVHEVLATLPPTDRAVLVLRFFEDLSVDEVAARMSLTAGAVRNRSMRALQRLRALIDDPQLIGKD
jgi:RNA polymerase sigma-70 factor (sigma-E family)